MGSITSLKCVLTQEHLDAICAKYFILEEVHPQLPSPDATMHERPAGKVGMCTRFFDYANYRIPFSTFFMSVLTHFRIPFSQLSVFGSAKNYKNGWFGFTKRPNVRAYYSKNLDSVKNWNDHFFWVDEFVVPANARFKMDLNAFIHTADPRKVRIVERARAKNERPIVTVAKHRTVTLLPTSVVRSSEELSASVEREFVGDASVGDGGDQGLRADHGTTGGSATGGKYPSVLNMLLQDSRLMVEQGVPALPTLPFITSSVTASPLEEGGDHTDSVTGPSLPTIGPSARFVVLSDSSHHSSAKSADPEVDSLVRSAVPVMTEATTVTTIATTVVVPADVGKDKSAPHPSVFCFSSSSEKTDRTLSLLQGGQWTVTNGFELNDGRSCANMIDHFTPPAFFKTVREMEHEQLFAEFNVSAARNLSLSSEYVGGAKDKEIEELRSQLLKAKEESMGVAQLRARVSSLEATKGSLRGKVASAKEHNGLLEQECGSLKLKVTSLESTIAEKDRELSDLGASSSSLMSQNQSLVHEPETSFADLREKLEIYEGSMKWLEEFQDNLMRPLQTRLAEIDADFTRCCMRFQESFHPHLLNVVAGRRWLLTHGMKLLMAKYLNSTKYMEALEHAFGRAIEKGMQEGLAAGIEHGQAGRCLTDLEAYIPSMEVDFNSVVRDLRDLDFPLLQELSDKKDASTWDVMDLLCLDDTVVEALGMTDLQPDVSQLMVPVHHKQDRVVIGSQALSVALDIFEPLVEVPATNVLSTVVIVPHSGPSVSVEDYENPDLVDVVPKNVTPGPEGEENIDASTGGDLAFSKLDDEARDVVLVPLMMAKHCDFCLIDLAFSRFAGKVSLLRYSWIDVIQESPSSSTTESTSTSFTDFSFNSSTSTCLLRCAKLVDAILLSASALFVSLFQNLVY
ncbi:hypothetical protein Tco_0353681 [Tanacetum coccineum]